MATAGKLNAETLAEKAARRRDEEAAEWFESLSEEDKKEFVESLEEVTADRKTRRSSGRISLEGVVAAAEARGATRYKKKQHTRKKNRAARWARKVNRVAS